MYYVRNDGNIVIEIKQLIFNQIVLYKIISKCYINTKMNSSKMK